MNVTALGGFFIVLVAVGTTVFAQSTFQSDLAIAAQISRKISQDNTVRQAAIALAAKSTNDVDGYALPLAPAVGVTLTGGGLVPPASGAPTTDGFGVRLGYCAWDNGSSTGASGYLAGSNSLAAITLAVVSAGSDNKFDTTCAQIAAGLPASGDDYYAAYTAGQILAGVQGNTYFADPVNTAADLLLIATGALKDGQVRLVKATNQMYRYVSGTASWTLVSRWASSATAGDINFTAGNVSIGATTAQRRLTIQSTGVPIGVVSTGARNGVDMLDATTAVVNAFFGYDAGTSAVRIEAVKSGTTIALATGGGSVNVTAAGVLDAPQGITAGPITASAITSSGPITTSVLQSSGPMSISATALTVSAQTTFTSSVAINGSLSANGGISSTNGAFSGTVTAASFNGTTFTGTNFNASTVNAGAVLVGGNAVWHAGNFSPSNYVSRFGDQMAGALGVSAMNALSGIYGGGNAANDTFTVDTDKVLHHYGLTWKLFSTDTSTGASAALSGFGGVRMYTAGQERLRVDFAGNLGLGTSAPAYKLDVNSTNSIAMRLNTTGTAGTGIWMTTNGVGTAAIGVGPAYASTAGLQDLAVVGSNNLILATSGNVERMRIDTSGNVGIAGLPSSKLDIYSGTGSAVTIRNNYGFSSPNYSLRLIGDTANYGYISQNPAAGGIVIADGMRYYGAGPWTPDSTSASSIRQVGGNIIFSSNSGLTAGVNFTPTERFRINNLGQVGIGTSTPQATLDIGGAFSPNAVNLIMGRGADVNFMLLSRNGASNATGTTQFTLGMEYALNGTMSAGLNFIRGGGQSDSALAFYAGAAEQVRVNANGNVSIGTAGDAGYKLYVNGTIGSNNTITSTATEALRIKADNGYISFYNAAGTVSTGYLQGNTSGGMALFSTTNNLSFGIGSVQRLIITPSSVGIGTGTSSLSSTLQVGASGSGLLNEIYIPGNYGSNEGAYIGSATNNGGAKLELNTHTSSTASSSWRIQHETDTYGAGNLVFLSAPSQQSRSSFVYAERMRLDASGYLGIGTTAPQARLHVGGVYPNLSISGVAGESTFMLGNQDSAGVSGPNIIKSANRTLQFGVGTQFTGTGGTFTSYQSIDPNGYVSFGSAPYGATPGRVSILESSEMVGIDIRSYQASNSGYRDKITTLIQGSGGNGGYNGNVAIKFHHNDYFNLSGDMSFWTKTNSNIQSEVMRISAAGNVGIGTSTPGAKLTIATSPGTTGIIINGNTSSGSLCDICIGRTGPVNATVGAGSNIQLSNTTTGSTAMIQETAGGLQFFTAPSGVWNERMRVSSNGNVGINVTNPMSPLDISVPLSEGSVTGTRFNNLNVGYLDDASVGTYSILILAPDLGTSISSVVSQVQGVVQLPRGSGSSYNRMQDVKIWAKRAYNLTDANYQVSGAGSISAAKLVRLTYGGSTYIGMTLGFTSSGPVFFTGDIYTNNGDANIMRVVRNTEVGSLTDWKTYESFGYASQTKLYNSGSLVNSGRVISNALGTDMTFGQAGDLMSIRADNTGVVYFGNTGSKYIYWDGTNYTMPGGGITNGTFNVSATGQVNSIGGYSPANGAIRLTPNLHLNAMAGSAVIVNWDNGTTGSAPAFRVGNGAAADVAIINADGTASFNGRVSTPSLKLNRRDATAGGISWYSPDTTAWIDYMSPNGQANSGPFGNVTAPAGTLVTSWAQRRFIENVAGYGWTWESGTSQGQPSVVAELRSSDGRMRLKGGLASEGTIDLSGDNYLRSGPNSTWGAYLRVGGNGRISTTDASVVTTNGNLHLDSANGYALYLNYYSNGSLFGPGGSTIMTSANKPIIVGRNRYHSSDGTSINNASQESGFDYNTGGSGLYGSFLSFGGGLGNGLYDAQISTDYGSGSTFKMRTRNGDNGGSWNSWKTLVTDQNYTNYKQDSITHLGRVPSEIGRATYRSGVYTYGTYTVADQGGNPPLSYPEILSWGEGGSGTIQIAGDWIAGDRTPLRVRSLRDCCQNWSAWTTILTSGEQPYAYSMNQNVRTTDAPTFAGVTATGGIAADRISAGFDTGLSGSVNASNWFRSNGPTGWYNQTYGGGIFMQNSSDVEVYGGKNLRLAGTIYSGSILSTGSYGRTSHSGGYLAGSYNSVGSNDGKSNPIYVIGTAYAPTDAGLANMYGIGYSHANFFGSSAGADWGMYVANGGVIGAIITGGNTGRAWFRGDVTSASITTGNLFMGMSGTGISVFPGINSDPYGTIAVTRPADGNSYSYFGMTRSGQVGVNIGVDTSNRFFIGSGQSGYGTANVGSRVFTVDMSGNVVATNITLTSDRRFKTNVATVDINSLMSKFMATRPVGYNLISSGQYNTGYIAQEIQGLFPHMVQTIDAQGHLGVSYTQMIPVLHAVAQRHELQIAELKETKLDNATDKWIESSDKNGRLFFEASGKTAIRGYGDIAFEVRNGEDQAVATFRRTGDLDLMGVVNFRGATRGGFAFNPTGTLVSSMESGQIVINSSKTMRASVRLQHSPDNNLAAGSVYGMVFGDESGVGLADGAGKALLTAKTTADGAVIAVHGTLVVGSGTSTIRLAGVTAITAVGDGFMQFEAANGVRVFNPKTKEIAVSLGSDGTVHARRFVPTDVVQQYGDCGAQLVGAIARDASGQPMVCTR